MAPPEVTRVVAERGKLTVQGTNFHQNDTRGGHTAFTLSCSADSLLPLQISTNQLTFSIPYQSDEYANVWAYANIRDTDLTCCKLQGSVSNVISKSGKMYVIAIPSNVFSLTNSGMKTTPSINVPRKRTLPVYTLQRPIDCNSSISRKDNSERSIPNGYTGEPGSTLPVNNKAFKFNHTIDYDELSCCNSPGSSTLSTNGAFQLVKSPMI